MLSAKSWQYYLGLNVLKENLNYMMLKLISVNQKIPACNVNSIKNLTGNSLNQQPANYIPEHMAYLINAFRKKPTDQFPVRRIKYE